MKTKDDQFLKTQLMLLVARFGYLKVAQSLAPFQGDEVSLEEIEAEVVSIARPLKKAQRADNRMESDALQILSDAILNRRELK